MENVKDLGIKTFKSILTEYNELDTKKFTSDEIEEKIEAVKVSTKSENSLLEKRFFEKKKEFKNHIKQSMKNDTTFDFGALREIFKELKSVKEDMQIQSELEEVLLA